MGSLQRKQNFEQILAEARGPDERRRLARLYGVMNAEARRLESRIAELEAPSETDSLVVVTRPPSSIEALATRNAQRDTILEAVNEELSSNAAFDLITVNHAEEIVAGYREDALVTELGCFESRLVSSHRNGYVKVNLRRTRSRVEGSTSTLINSQVYLHQLALVASGRLGELKATFLSQEGVGGGEFQVSHLCHNGKCFNQEHLLVEPSADNKARNSCQGQSLVKYKNEFVHDPCVHRTLSMRKRCILPVERYSDPGSYRHV